MLIVAAVVMIATLAPSSPKPVGSSGSSSSLTAYIQKGVSVSDSTLEAIGLPSNVLAPNSVADGASLTQNGKPVVVFVGGEFCPTAPWSAGRLLWRCSGSARSPTWARRSRRRRPMSSLGLQSWSFKDSAFTSSSLAFAPAEVYSSTPNSTGTGYEPLQSLTPLQSQAFNAYSDRGYPFVDIGGKYVALGASANPGVLQNLTLDQIASQLDNPSSPVAQAVDGTADY